MKNITYSIEDLSKVIPAVINVSDYFRNKMRQDEYEHASSHLRYCFILNSGNEEDLSRMILSLELPDHITFYIDSLGKRLFSVMDKETHLPTGEYCAYLMWVD